MIYKQKPNVLRVSYGFSDEHHDNDESVYLVNVTPAQVLAALVKLKDESPAVEAPKKKDRKPRRTKAELDAARGPVLDGDAFHGDKMPDEDQARKQHAEKKETAWP